MKRKTHIRRTISKTRRIVVRRKPNDPETRDCEICEDTPPMLEPDQIREIYGISERITFRFLEESTVHFQEGENKKIYVCLGTLSRELERNS